MHTSDAYRRWQDIQAARAPEDRQAHICEEMSDLCAEWICEHVRAYGRGEYVPFSWRRTMRALVLRVRPKDVVSAKEN
jgi:hypothetical protein